LAGGEDWVKKSMKKTATGSAALKKQTKIVMSKALEEDPTVFQYDEVSCLATRVSYPDPYSLHCQFWIRMLNMHRYTVVRTLLAL
jgi:hypothetical protein